MLDQDVFHALQVVLLDVVLGLLPFDELEQIRVLAADVEVGRALEHVAHLADQRVERRVQLIACHIHDLGPAENVRHGAGHGLGVVRGGQLGNQGHAARVGECHEVAQVLQGVHLRDHALVHGDILRPELGECGGRESECLVVRQVKLAVPDLPQPAGFDHGLQGVDGDALAGAVDHRAGVVGVRPVLDLHARQGVLAALAGDGLEDCGGAFRHGAVVPALHHGRIADRDRVREVACVDELLLLRGHDVRIRPQRGVELQPDIALVRLALFHLELEAGDRLDLVGQHGRERHERRIARDNPASGGQGHRPLLNGQRFRRGHEVGGASRQRSNGAQAPGRHRRTQCQRCPSLPTHPRRSALFNSFSASAYTHPALLLEVHWILLKINRKWMLGERPGTVKR